MDVDEVGGVLFAGCSTMYGTAVLDEVHLECHCHVSSF